MDEPMRITRAGDADAADGSASPSESDWRAGLAELISTLQHDLTEALDSAREQALSAVRTIEERGEQLFGALDDERSALDSERSAEQSAREERVAALQADIDGVEAEIADARADAEREAETTRAAARRRADTIIAEAEARAESIIAEARERAGGVGAGTSGAATSAGEGQHDVHGRLRGLSDRVGKLLSQPAAGAAAGVAAAGVAAAASVPSSPAASPVTPPAEPPLAPPLSTPAPAVEPEHDALSPATVVSDADQEAEEQSTVASQPSVLAAPPPAPVVQMPPTGSSSWFKGDDLADDDEPTATSEAITEMSSAAPVWSPSDALRVPDDEDEEEEDRVPPGLHAVPTPAREAARPASAPDTAPAGPVTQTLIFQAVPNFQAALALERSLKAMSEVREVRVADFDERQLTFQVTHELGDQLSRVLLTQRGSELELVDSRPERVEFVFRS